jgi:hypothetical protein
MRIVRVLACMLHLRRQRDAAAMLIEGVSLKITSITQLSHAHMLPEGKRIFVWQGRPAGQMGDEGSITPARA